MTEIQHKKVRKTALPRTGRELDAVNGTGGMSFSSSGGGTGGVTDHSQLTGVKNIEEYQEGAKDVHLTSEYADHLKRLAKYRIVKAKDPVEKITDNDIFTALATLAHFLRKDAPDVAEGLIKFLKGAEFGEFISSMITGTGARIDASGHAEFDSVAIRKWLETPELRYNRAYVVGDELWVTPGGKFDTVTKAGNLFIVKMKLEEGELVPLMEGDILKGIYYDKSTDGNIKGFRTLWFRVNAVDQASQTITVASRYPDDEKYNPVPFLEVARIGSFTNEERQRSILIDGKENCITFLDNVNTWDITPAMEVCWFGRKDRSIPGVPSTAGYNAKLSNIIMSGKIFQYDEISGNDYLVPIDKGSYIPGRKYAYYDRVSATGGLWLCVNENGTTSAPGVNSSDWQLQVSDGSFTKYQFAVNTSLTTAPSTGWQDTPPAVASGQYLWMRTGIVTPPATEPEKWAPVRIGGEKGDKGEQGPQGIQGTQGVKGDKGDSGTSQYFHVRYSANANGNPMSTTPNTYIGTVVTSSKTAPTSYTDYTWTQFKGSQGAKGEQGIPGTNGANGKTSYLHIKYSNDGKTFTANNGETPGAWIGQYVDYTEADSNTFSAYTWNKIKGDKGDTGPAGAQGPKGDTGPTGSQGIPGTSQYFHVKYSANSNGNPMSDTPNTYIGTVVTSSPTAPTSYSSYKWVQLKGSQGPKGDQGIKGATGANGVSSYLHIKYSDNGTSFTANNGETPGQWIGQYVDSNPTDSTVFSVYTWSKIKGDKGDKGATGATGPKGDTGPTGSQGIPGTSSYFHVKYSANANGNPMSDTPNTYIGTAVTTSATAPTSYTAYKWVQLKGSQGAKGELGIAGPKGTDGKTSYLHIKYSNDGKTFTANNGETPGAWIGQYTDFTQADSNTFSTYTWTKIKGDTGATGPKGDKGDTGDIKLNHLGADYSPYTAYKTGDVVPFNGGKIYCKKDNTGVTPVSFLKTGGKFIKTGGMYLLAVPLTAANLNKTYWEIFQDKPIVRATRWLTSNTSVIRFNTIGSPVPSTAIVQCKRQRDGLPVEDCADLWLTYRTYAETTYISQSTPVKTISVTLTNLRADGIYYVRGYENEQDAKDWNGNFTTEFTITHANDGIGQTGDTGASPRMRGMWSGSISDYVWNSQWRDIVIRTVNGVNIQYAVKVKGTVPANIDPSSSAGATYWEQAQQFKFIATDLLLADKIKSDMIDTNGLIVNTLKTSTSGVRIEIAPAGNNTRIKAIDSNGSTVLSIGFEDHNGTASPWVLLSTAYGTTTLYPGEVSVTTYYGNTQRTVGIRRSSTGKCMTIAGLGRYDEVASGEMYRMDNDLVGIKP